LPEPRRKVEEEYMFFARLLRSILNKIILNKIKNNMKSSKITLTKGNF